MSRAIVVGSGAGGAAVASKLQGVFDVTILEAGREFERLTMQVAVMERLKRTGLLFDARTARLIFPHMRVRKALDGMVVINAIGVGGTTTISTGNALRMDADLQALGINLDAEFEEIYREIPVSTEHQDGWHQTTRDLFAICQELGLGPAPTPKMGDYASCVHCGRCVFGCPHKVKWDARQFVRQAQDHGALLVAGCTVDRVVIENGRVTGVRARTGLRSHFVPADLVVLAAGGLATPRLLQRSGIACEPRLFIDPVLCVAGRLPKSQQCYEVEMPFVVQRDRYILSPYFDFLSFIFNRDWRYPARDTVR